LCFSSLIFHISFYIRISKTIHIESEPKIREIDSINDSQSELNLIQNTIAKQSLKERETIASGGSIACKIHPEKNVEYICKTEHLGLCSKCLYSHYKEGHQIS